MKRFFLLLVMALLAACSSAEKRMVDPNDALIKNTVRDGLQCRTVYILKEHGGVMTCRDSSGTIRLMRDASFVTPWGREVAYYPDGKIASEVFYESMSVMPAYKKDYYKNGNLKYAENAAGKRSYREDGTLLEVDSMAGDWHYTYKRHNAGEFEMDGGAVKEEKIHKGSDSVFVTTYTHAGEKITESFYCRNDMWKKHYDADGNLEYFMSKDDSSKVETDYYPDGKVWMEKNFTTIDLSWRPETVVLTRFREFAVNGVALREYDLDVHDPQAKPVCRFKNEAGELLERPARRMAMPYSMQDHCKTCVYIQAPDLPDYSFVDRCAVQQRL